LSLCWMQCHTIKMYGTVGEGACILTLSGQLHALAVLHAGIQPSLPFGMQLGGPQLIWTV